MGSLEWRVPQGRQGRFSTERFEPYQRREKALVAALAQMYVQGVSTRKVKAVTEALCGPAFSASAVTRRAVADDCLTERRWRYERRDAQEARRALSSWLAKWQTTHPKLCEWGGAKVEET